MISSRQKVHALLDTVSLAAKVIAFDSEHIDFLLDQVADPKNYRPLKALYKHDRALRYNPKTGIWQLREAKSRVHHSLERKSSRKTDFGYPKETHFTKKTSVTLLPPHAKIKFYNPKDKPPVGLLFDLNLCHLKDEKYIFPRMVNTDERWWLSRSGKHHEVTRSIPLETLRQILREVSYNDQVLSPNELLVGLSKEALVGVFSLNDSREMRLHSLVTQQKIERALQITLPIFIIDQQGIKEYTSKRQQEDLFELSVMNAQLYQKYLLEFNLSLQKSLTEKNYPVFQLDLLYKNATQSIFEFLTVTELATFSRVNKKYYFMLNDESQKYLWVNSTRKIIQAPLGANKHDLQILSQQAKYRLPLETLARRDHNNAYALMHSNVIRDDLPADQKKLTHTPRSRTTQFFYGMAGLLLGLAIGIVRTLVETIIALFSLSLRIIVIGMAEYCMYTSFLRRVLGVTVFPIYSILKSAYFGAHYGWNYGLSPISTLNEGIHRFHFELYNGYSRNSSSGAADPWHDCRPSGEHVYSYADETRTNIYQFFKDSHFKTVADIANHVEKRKPTKVGFFKPTNPNKLLEPETKTLVTTQQQRKVA